MIVDGIRSSVFVTVAVGSRLVIGATLELDVEVVVGTVTIDVWMVDGGRGTEVSETDERVLGVGRGVDTSELVELTVEGSELVMGVGSDVVEGGGVGGTLSVEIEVDGTLVVSMDEVVELPSVGGKEVEDPVGIEVDVTDTELGISVPGVVTDSEGVGSDVEPDSEGVGSGVENDSEGVGSVEDSEAVTFPELDSEGVGTEITSEDSEGGGTEVTLLDSEGVGTDEVSESLGGTSEGVGSELVSIAEDSEGVG